MIALSVIIVSYRDMDAVKKCVASLPTADWLEVLVIDNTNDNRGFSRACNQAAKLAKGKVLLFLNPDCELIQGDLLKIVKMFETDKRLGIVGPELVDKAGRHVPSYSLQPTARTAPVVYSILNKWFKKSQLVKNHWLKKTDKHQSQEVGVVSGAALFIDKKVFEKSGGFDEQFFMFWEEVDLCRRALDLGYKVMYDPSVVFYHQGGSSSRQVKGQTQQWFKDSRFSFFKKHFGWLYGLVIETWLTVMEEWRFILVMGFLLGAYGAHFWLGAWSVWQVADVLAYWLSVGAIMTMVAGVKEVWMDTKWWRRLLLIGLLIVVGMTVPKLWLGLLVGAAGWWILDGVKSWRRFRDTWVYGWMAVMGVVSAVVLIQVQLDWPVLSPLSWKETLTVGQAPFGYKPKVSCVGCSKSDETLIKLWSYQVTNEQEADVIVALPPYSDYQYPDMLMMKRGRVLVLWPNKLSSQ